MFGHLPSCYTLFISAVHSKVCQFYAKNYNTSTMKSALEADQDLVGAEGGYHADDAGRGFWDPRLSLDGDKKWT
jgi:hypothetical protein